MLKNTMLITVHAKNKQFMKKKAQKKGLWYSSPINREGQ